MADNNTLGELIQKGIDAGKAELKARADALAKVRQGEQTGLRAAYNAARGVIAGLKALQDRPDSKFKYYVEERGDYLHIDTNIEEGYDSSCCGVVLSVNAKPDGEITARGLDGYSRPKVTRDDADQVLKSVAKEAKVKGLVK